MCALLIEAGHSDSAIMKRTGHRVHESLKNYQHLLGCEALHQQRSLCNARCRGFQEDIKLEFDGISFEEHNANSPVAHAHDNEGLLSCA